MLLFSKRSASFFYVAAALHAGTTLDAVKRAGILACGVVTEQNDFTKDDTHGDLSAFGGDWCRAVGAAVLGDSARVHIDGFPDEAQAYQALQHGEIDLLVGVSPKPDLSRRYQAVYGQPVFFDGQGFLVDERAHIATLRDLSGKSVCFIANTDAETRARDALAGRGIVIKPFPFEEMGEMEAALVGGRCDAETADASVLAAGRARFHGRAQQFELLPDVITLDPLVPAMRADDTEWQLVVDCTLHALVDGEIDGVTKSRALARRGAERAVKNDCSDSARHPGLSDGWSLSVIRAVGNYGELFDGDLGQRSSFRLGRGVNRAWTSGGLLLKPF